MQLGYTGGIQGHYHSVPTITTYYWRLINIMAKAICAKSGIEFTIQYFPYSFDEGELHHPVFDLSYEQLTSPKLLNKWVNRELTEIDTKLYFLALLHSSNLIAWNTYARPTIAVCELNMEPLLDILGWMHTIKHPRLSMPHMAITADTATLDNVRNWIAAWNSAKQDFESGYKDLSRNQLMLRKEDTLQKLIRDKQKELHDFAGILADWAVLSADFPTFSTTVNGVTLPISEYWKQILVTCSKTPTHIWRLNIDDMRELLQHLEEHLEHGSIYAHATMKLIRDGIATHDNYLGFSIVNYAEDVERANIQILVDNAPATLPRIQDYPNKIAYLKAKICYEQAQKAMAATTVPRLTNAVTVHIADTTPEVAVPVTVTSFEGVDNEDI